VQDHTDRFVAITDVIYFDPLENGMPKNKITKIPNCIDTHRFKPVELCEKQKAKNLLGLSQNRIVTYVGNLTRARSLNVLLTSWKEVSHSRPEVHLLIVGKTEPEKEFEYLSSLVQELGIGNSATFTREAHLVCRYLDITDVFVLPSFQEGISEAMLEVPSCRLPVVVTNIPGVEDVIIHDVNGSIVPPRDS